MKKSISIIIVLATSLLLGACTENLDPLAPGSTDGQFALGMKTLVPIVVGNRWTYRATVYDTTTAVRTSYLYDVAVVDTALADTSLVPLALRTRLSFKARLWYRIVGEMGQTSFWQVDSMEQYLVRKSDELFPEQLKFNFLAAIGDAVPTQYFSSSFVVSPAGDTTFYAADSVRIRLASKGDDTKRTTLGSTPWFQYTQSFAARTDTIQYYFKPGFGKVLSEEFRTTLGEQRIVIEETNWFHITSDSRQRIRVTITLIRNTTMKHLFASLALVVLLTSVGTAQMEGQFEISASSGLALPSSPMTFSEYWNMQYGGGIGVGYYLTSSTSLTGFVEYYRFNIDQGAISNAFNTAFLREVWILDGVGTTPSADPSSILTVGVNARFATTAFLGSIAPYLVVGAGMMQFTLSEIALPTTSILTVNGEDIAMTAERRITGGTETAAFIQCGAGFDINLTESIRPYLEARYVLGMTKGIGTNYLPLTAGVRMSF